MGVQDYPTKIVQLLLGSLIAAFSIRNFLASAGLLAGGISGLALVLNYLAGLPLELTIIGLNIPIFLIGLRYLHWGYLFRSLIGVGSFSFFLYLFRFFPPLRLDDILLSAIFGGFLSGVGYGLLFRARGSVGGTDIIALVLHRLYAVGVGEINLAFNVLIMLLSTVLFDLRVVGYTLISMFITGYVVDQIQLGLNRAKTVIIISNQAEPLAEAILYRLHRGVTFLHGEGAFSHTPKRVILCTVSLTQLAKLKDLVMALDPDAFLMVSDTVEVLGKGFQRMDGF